MDAVTQMESCTADYQRTVTAAIASCAGNTEVTGPAAPDPDHVTASGLGGAGYTLSATSKSTGVFNITKSSGSPGSYTRTCSGGTKGCNGTSW